MATLRSMTAFLRPISCVCRLHCGLKTASALQYKSQYNIEHLYPKSNPDFISKPVTAASKGILSDDSQFSGYIPDDALNIRYSRSSGAGGQHVNKVNTKVEIRFHVETAEWIPKHLRGELLKKEKSRITKDGYIIVTSEKTRSQLMNQADCLDKIRALIFAADVKPYEPTADEVAVLHKRKEAARKGILRQKKIHSLKKQSRGGTQL